MPDILNKILDVKATEIAAAKRQRYFCGLPKASTYLAIPGSSSVARTRNS